jgi:hypothetical protein
VCQAYASTLRPDAWAKEDQVFLQGQKAKGVEAQKTNAKLAPLFANSNEELNPDWRTD